MAASRMRYAVRNDNMCEVAMLLAFDATTRPRPQHRAIAVNLLDYIFLKSGLALGNRANPASPEYGLVGWSFDYPNSYWSDDNARSMLSLLAASALLNANAGRGGRDSWGGSLTATPTTNLSFSLDDAVTRCVLANFRTTGVYGFREDMITAEDLQKSGWRHYWDAGNTRFSPHYAGWLWLCYLWAYEKTHFEPFLSRSETAMRMLLQAYPDRWYWTDRSGSIERARALLPLAWLVRVHDTPEHRGWLRRVAGDLIALQDASGAIRETIGGGGHGTVSNAEYGTCETSLIQSDGDPIADMLYTCNFALIGLHEAAAATGEPLYAAAEEKLAKFLCRIQIRSDGDCPNFRANENGTVPFAGHPELDGAWYRGLTSATGSIGPATPTGSGAPGVPKPAGPNPGSPARWPCGIRKRRCGIWPARRRSARISLASAARCCPTNNAEAADRSLHQPCRNDGLLRNARQCQDHDDEDDGDGDHNGNGEQEAQSQTRRCANRPPRHPPRLSCRGEFPRKVEPSHIIRRRSIRRELCRPQIPILYAALWAAFSGDWAALLAGVPGLLTENSSMLFPVES